jgi:hypothetical protein
MNGKVKSLVGDGQVAAYVRWGILIFSIGVTWANLKADVREAARNQERFAAAQGRVNERFQNFIDGTTARNENQAGWYERVYRAEQDIADLQTELVRLSNRAPIQSRAYRNAPQTFRSYPLGSSISQEPNWQNDPRRNPQ